MRNKDERKEYSKQYRIKNLERQKEAARRGNASVKQAALEHYSKSISPECECCGESIIEFLTIDHINGGGTQQRKKTGGGSSFYWWLKRNSYPIGYRVLCFNCNCSIGFFGYCPHGNITKGDEEKKELNAFPLFYKYRIDQQM